MENRREFLKKMTASSLGLASIAPSFFNNDRKLNVALVGLGRYAEYMADAISTSAYCKLAGLVSGSPEKAIQWAKKYNVPEKNIYNYQNFDKIATNADIDLVYVIVPNALHKEYVIRAANAKKHVLVEKPMAISAKECIEMINVCEQNQVKLAVGYRLHFEPYNMELMRLGQKKVHGQVRLVDAALGYKTNPDANDWHVKKALSGGGPLTNLGVYCVQAARYILGEEPVAATAQFGPITNSTIFKEVEESITWQLTFPSGAISTGTTSYNYGIDRVFAAADEGFFELSPAISYGPFKGRTHEGPLSFADIDQQKTQMDTLAPYFMGTQPIPDHINGYEGLRDLKVIDAIYKAARTGKKIKIA